MAEDPNPILRQESIDTLEKLAFIFAYPDEEREVHGDGPYMAARVAFEGPFGGELVIVMAAAALPELAANMLGIETEEAADDQQQDALKEALNVICGNLLPAWAGKDSLFNIQAPEILAPDTVASLKHEGAPTAVARLALDNGWCDLLLFGAGKAK